MVRRHRGRDKAAQAVASKVHWLPNLAAATTHNLLSRNCQRMKQDSHDACMTTVKHEVLSSSAE